MKKIDIIIPTRNRWKKLMNCLRSIIPVAGFEIAVTVVCDEDEDTASRLLELNDDLRPGRIIYVKDHEGSVYCRNLATQIVEDGMICTPDDITFERDAIAKAFWAMRGYFPDDDGVIGFSRADREGQKKKEKEDSGFYAGVALVGQKFLRRFPNRKLFYPEYFLFAAQEVTNFAVKLKKLRMIEDAKITHHAPRKTNGPDQTHFDGRVFKHRDRALRRERAEKGLLWGEKNTEDKT